MASIQSRILLLLALTSSASIARGADEKPAEAPKPPVVVTLGASDKYAHYTSSYVGFTVNQQTQAYSNEKRDEVATVFPNCGGELEYKLEIAAQGGDRTVHAAGTITDFHGNELAKFDKTIAAKDGATATDLIVIKPAEANEGPFFVNGTWDEASSGTKGELYYVAGQANWRLVLEDFELMRYPLPEKPLQSTQAAAHRGQSGLQVKIIAPPPVALAPGQRPPEPVEPKQILPLNLVLPSRPVKIGLWVKPSSATSISMTVKDPGIEARQTRFPDTWTIGPVKLEAGDWRYVEIPMPGFGRTEAKIAPHGESNGVVDYPLTLVQLEFSGPADTVVMVDDLECFSQGSHDGSLFIRAVASKPTGLLYRNDSLGIAITNAWLWGAPAQVQYSASLSNVADQPIPLASGSASVEPGAELVVPAAFQQLLIGPYTLSGEVTAADKRSAKTPPKSRYVVYEPTGKALDPAALYGVMSDRNRLLVDLGFERDNLMVNWHSVDGAPAVEQFPGIWTYEWIDPQIKARRDAGLEVIGTLGLTALWADPSAAFNPMTSAWNGSVYVLPSRSIYWEEYVLRTVEHYRGTIDTWIVWDRPDSAVLNSTPREFTNQMLEVAYKAAHEASPDVKLISGGITRENVEKYLIGMSEAGAQYFLDGIGVLPSPAPLSPEDGYMDVILARAQRIREQEHLKPELWVLELGWPTGDNPMDVSEIEQAVYLPRAYIMCRSQGIKQILLKPDRTQVTPRRDSADLVFPDADLTGIKPAALSAKTVRSFVRDSEFIREIFLHDRADGMARAYLFKQPDGKLLLVAWRREGTSTLPLPAKPVSITDTFGNAVAPGADAAHPTVQLAVTPVYMLFDGIDPIELTRTLERSPLQFADAPESAWKGNFTFHLDVGDPTDEAKAQYQAPGSRVVGPLDSYYHNEYGRHAVDSGRHFTAGESFVVDVSAYGDADMMLKKRINYSVQNQLVRVFCNDQLVGQWYAFKRDRRFRWRDINFVIPNSFFAGKPTAQLRFEAVEGEATSYYFWAGPIKTKTIYCSDLPLLVNTSGYGPGVNLDKNIIGGAMKFYSKEEKPTDPIEKGLGTNAADSLPKSLVVLPLNEQFKKFKATVGIDAATNGRGSVRFRLGDGTKTLWDSGDMNYYSAPKDVEIDVSDAIILMLWVDDLGDGHENDIANWAGARLELK